MSVRARVEAGFAALVVAAVVVYAVSDDGLVDTTVYVGVMVAASIAAWVGAQRAPAEHRTVARLVAVGISLTALGDLVWEALDARGPTPDVSMADPLWCASYVALCAALCVVLRRSSIGRRDGLAFALDAATIVTVSVLLFWSTAVSDILSDATVAPHVRVVWAVYPIADAVLLALVVRVLTSRRARAALDVWFAVGVILWLAADMLYLQSPTGATEITMDALWMVAPVLMARTAWRRHAAPAPAPNASGSRARMAQLGIAIGSLLVPPVLEYVSDLRGEPHRPTLLIVGATLLTLLALARMALLIRSEEQAHHELELARDAALEASRAKSMFLATMSHEIRTPLTMVLGAGEMLEETPLDELQADLVRRMRRSGGLLRALVDGILDFSRIEAGQVELSPGPFDLHLLVDDLADVYLPRAAAAGIGFACAVGAGVPRTVVGDADRLLQVLSNLLDNAFKFTHEGRVRLAVRTLSGEQRAGHPPSGRWVEVVVADTGIGISPEHVSSVFESFRQVDGSTTRRYGGTGLGLAICKELTELMGGSLTVTSEAGVGSSFAVRLPLEAPVPRSDGDPGAPLDPAAADRDGKGHAVRAAVASPAPTASG